jgi:hypothetical protein
VDFNTSSTNYFAPSCLDLDGARRGVVVLLLQNYNYNTYYHDDGTTGFIVIGYSYSYIISYTNTSL